MKPVVAIDANAQEIVVDVQPTGKLNRIKLFVFVVELS